MTAPVQNSELSVTAPAEPVEFVVLERCAEGQAMITKWQKAVRAERNVDEAWRIFNGYMYGYIPHLKACDVCRAYQIARHAKYDDLPEETK